MKTRIKKIGKGIGDSIKIMGNSIKNAGIDIRKGKFPKKRKKKNSKQTKESVETNGLTHGTKEGDGNKAKDQTKATIEVTSKNETKLKEETKIAEDKSKHEPKHPEKQSTIPKKHHDLNEIKTLVIDEVRYKTKLTAKFLDRKPWKGIPAPENIISPLTGKVKNIKGIGDHIKKGEWIVKIESMKMHNQILAEADLIIKEVHCEENEQIAKGKLLLVVRFTKKGLIS